MNHRFGLAAILAVVSFSVACTQETTAPEAPSSEPAQGARAPKPVADTVTVQDENDGSDTDGGTTGDRQASWEPHRQMPGDP